MENTLSFRVLGPLEMRINGQKTKPGGPRQHIILSILLLAEGRVVSIDKLAEGIWGENPPITSRTQISIGIAGLRKIIRQAGWDTDLITTVTPGYQLLPDGVTIDSADFTRLVRESEDEIRRENTLGAVDLLNKAISLWRGKAFAGITSQLVEEGCVELEELRLVAYESRSSMQLVLGQHHTAAIELVPFVRENPLRERARGDLMLAHYRSGRRAEALAVFREGRNHLVEELGIEPGPDLQRIHGAILRGEAVVSRGCKTSAPSAPSQIPPAIPSFIGRDREMSLLNELLAAPPDNSAPAIGLVTGGPGSGKTSLAVRWAHTATEHFPDGQLYADLADRAGRSQTERSEEVLALFLGALGVPPDRLPPEGTARTALYRTMLHGRRILILLDNAESDDQLAPLLPGSGTCGVLVTSRSSYREAATGNETLHLRLTELSADTSVALLASIIGGQRLADDPAGVRKLVTLCEGLPLALQAAGIQLLARPHWTASRLVHRVEAERRVDGVSQFDRELHDSFTLTYSRLRRPVAAAFRRVAKLSRNPFDVATAAAAMNLDAFTTEDLLEQLVDVGLLHAVIYPREGTAAEYRIPALLKVYAAQERTGGALHAIYPQRVERGLATSG